MPASFLAWKPRDTKRRKNGCMLYCRDMLQCAGEANKNMTADDGLHAIVTGDNHVGITGISRDQTPTERMLRSGDFLLSWMRFLGAVLLGVAGVCTASAANLSAAITCASNNYAMTQCNVSTSAGHVVSVELIQQLSKTNCTANDTYGLTSDHTAIWVKGGCRGNFMPVLETDGTTLQETTSQRVTSPTQGVTTKVETSGSSRNPLSSSAHGDAFTESTEDASARTREVTSAAQLDSTTTSAPDSEQPSSRGSSGDVTLTTTSHGVTSTIATAVSEAASDAAATDSSPRPTASALCRCACSRSSPGGEAEIAGLRADKASFSKSRRKKESSRDDRTSSVVMGTAAVATLCAVAVIFPLLDLGHVIRALQRARRMRQMPSSRPGTSGKTDTLKLETFKLAAPDTPLRDPPIC